MQLIDMHCMHSAAVAAHAEGSHAAGQPQAWQAAAGSSSSREAGVEAQQQQQQQQQLAAGGEEAGSQRGSSACDGLEGEPGEWLQDGGALGYACAMQVSAFAWMPTGSSLALS